MQWKRIGIVLLVTVVIAGLSWWSLGYVGDNVRLGLDLEGGVLVRMEAPEDATDEDMAKAIAVIDNRINGLGVTEPEIRREGDRRILVELPGVENPEEAVGLIGKTAQLQFVRGDSTEVILTGKDLKDAKEAMDQQAVDVNNRYYVSLDFNDEGKEIFADVTTELTALYTDSRDPNRVIYIVLDDQVISAPFVNEPITGGTAKISGSFETLEDANKLAVLLRSGALPVELEIVEKRTIGPKFGADSLVKSIESAKYGLLAILVFMILYYRLPGVVAGLSLVLYSVLVWLVYVSVNATITLPGIAGFLLSVGMAVDANIIIYERLKEEIKNGKSLRAAVDSGFSRAFLTIVDANVTTLIAAFVLMYFGTGTIRGFAFTLSIGIVVSMFTAITFTRFVLRQFALSGKLNNNWLYGA